MSPAKKLHAGRELAAHYAPPQPAALSRAGLESGWSTCQARGWKPVLPHSRASEWERVCPPPAPAGRPPEGPGRILPTAASSPATPGPVERTPGHPLHCVPGLGDSRETGKQSSEKDLVYPQATGALRGGSPFIGGILKPPRLGAWTGEWGGERDENPAF